ncbi:MAG TPA: ankyrin repeat domain-containing protein [Flavobacterium sp.]|nr:ankyrin repeat domain-containing protein [Flavobacterium sp.]
MNKSILCLGIALLAFSATSLASGAKTAAQQKMETSITISGKTPLAMAIQKGELDLVKKMVEYGADVNEKSMGMTPLMVAARYNKVEIIKFLLANGAHTYIKDEKGFTALKYAELSLATEAVSLLKQA